MSIAKWVLFLLGYLTVSIGVPILATFSLSSTLCWKEPIVGPIAATAVVAYSYFASPGYRIYTVVVGFIFGVLLAYQIPEMRWYPECHSEAYMRTYAPLAITYAFGLTSVVAILWWSKSKT